MISIHENKYDEVNQCFEILKSCRDLVLRKCELFSIFTKYSEGLLGLDSVFLLSRVKELSIICRGGLRLKVEDCPQRSHMKSLKIDSWDKFDTKSIKKLIQMPKITKIDQA